MPIALSVGNNTDSTAFSGGLSGLGSLIKIGTGSLTLSGYYTYINGTTISGGTLQLGNINALGTGGLTANGGVLDLSGNGISVPSFNGAGGVVTNSAVGTSAALHRQPIGKHHVWRLD